MLDLYINIKKRRNELGLTQSELAKRMGYADKSMIAKIEKGQVDLQQSKIVAFAEALGTTPAYLMGWTDNDLDLSKYDNIRPIGKQKLPVLGYIAAGEPIFMEELHEFDIENGEEIDADFILIAKGDSMIGARINSGDLVFIKQQPTVENGEIAAVAVDDEATLKRFYKYDDLVVLRSENPNYKDMEYKPEDGKEVRILGKAVAFQGKLV